MSFFGTGVDLDPTETDCCAWTKWVPMSAMGFKMTGKNRKEAYCGVDSNFDLNGHDGKDFCCEANLTQPDCDHKYFSTGVAWEDYMDFSRDEQLWLRQFARAWHMASENGM